MKIINKEDKTRRRIAAVGMWDGVHAGHRFLIDYVKLEGRARGLTPSVVTFSRHPLVTVRPLDAPRLLTSLEDRMALLGEAGAEDCIILSFNDKMRRMSAREFLSMLNRKFGVEALVVGFNNRFGRDRAEGIEQYRAIGNDLKMTVIEAPEYRGAGAPVSSSIIREHLRQGHVDKATEALGRPYRLRGIVVTGNRIGRTIGFPTANIRIPEPDTLIPAAGVYAAKAVTPDGETRPAMVNIGYRPTVNDTEAQREISIEAHILDFKGYLYDEEISIDFIARVRDEKKFTSLEKLRSRLTADAREIRKILG